MVAALLAPLPDGRRVHYAKHMTHHLCPTTPTWPGSARFRNVLLIRDPAEVVASYLRSREACEPDDIGLLQQVRLLDALPDDAVPVIDAADFLRDPEAYLRWLCDWLGIEFTDRMLHWPAGPREQRRRLGAVLVRRRRGARPASSRGDRARSTSRRTTPRSPRPAARRTTPSTRGGSGSDRARASGRAPGTY